MPMTLRLGRVRGIPVGLHYSWLIIAALITLSLAGHFRASQRDWSWALVWFVSASTALLFFATLLAHELSHAIVAQARGLRVRSITLFALGGIANIEEEANTAKTEFLVAAVGPVVSFAIGFACIAAARWLGWSLGDGDAGVVASALGWLGSINVLLAVFNLIPGYPLDGGRLLRALLWGIHKDVNRATRDAARLGQVVAGLFIAFGLLQFFGGGSFGGFWLAFIGWFLMMAAQSSYTQVSMGEVLSDARVGDVMANDCATIEPQVDVQRLVDDVLFRTGRRCVLVKSKGRVLGLVTPHEVRKIERAHWHDVTVGDVMRPIEGLTTVEPKTPVADALKAMARDDVGQLPVVADGQLQGVITRDQILRLLQSRQELKAA